MRPLLLIEDDSSYAQVLARRLQHYGWLTHWCENVPQAMQQADSLTLDVILLDQNLAGISSLPAIKMLKSCWPEARLIVVTGYASITSTVAAMKQGADNYLTKPVDIHALLREIAGEEHNPAELPEHSISVEALEWELIQSTLQAHQNNISATARALNMHRRTLQRKLLKKRPQSLR